MLIRLLIATLASHLMVSLGVFLFAGPFPAVYVFIGIVYVQVFNHVPILLISATGALVIFILSLRYARKKQKSFAIVYGIVPIIAFFCLSEVIKTAAMRISLRNIGEETCIYGVQSFTSSSFDILKSASLFENLPRSSHHAHVALSGKRVMIWSYKEMSFVTDETGESNSHRIPPKCRPLFSSS